MTNLDELAKAVEDDSYLKWFVATLRLYGRTIEPGRCTERGGQSMNYTKFEWKCTGEVRWRRFNLIRADLVAGKIWDSETVLQQKWLSSVTGAFEWRDVPLVSESTESRS